MNYDENVRHDAAFAVGTGGRCTACGKKWRKKSERFGTTRRSADRTASPDTRVAERSRSGEAPVRTTPHHEHVAEVLVSDLRELEAILLRGVAVVAEERLDEREVRRESPLLPRPTFHFEFAVGPLTGT